MTRIALLIVLAWVAACGSEPPPEAAEAKSASEEHFLSEHQKAMDKARKLQEELNASVEKRLEEVDRQTRDDRDDDQ